MTDRKLLFRAGQEVVTDEGRTLTLVRDVYLGDPVFASSVMIDGLCPRDGEVIPPDVARALNLVGADAR